LKSAGLEKLAGKEARNTRKRKPREKKPEPGLFTENRKQVEEIQKRPPLKAGSNEWKEES